MTQPPYGAPGGDVPQHQEGLPTPPRAQGAEQPTAPYGMAPPAPPAPVYGTQPPYGAPTPYSAAGYQPAPGYVPPGPKNDLGVLSLVFGLIAFFVFGLLAGIPAVILGMKGKQAVREGLANNDGMATTGIVFGWLGIAWSSLLILGWLGFVLLMVVGGVASYSG